MDLKLLKDNVYLTLLAFYNGKKLPSYTRIGEMNGITRQTASKRIKDLIEQEIITIKDDIINVKNVMDIDVKELAKILTENPGANVLLLKERLFTHGNESNTSIEEIAKELNIAESSVYNYQHTNMVVYGIISEGIIKYVGSTKCYENRIHQHILKRPFLTRNNFVILKQITENDRFFQERQLINILQPEWNIMGKE